jgi:hypothetical protein
MVVPEINSRMEESSEIFCQRIKPRDIRTLEKVTRETGPRQIICRSLPTVFFGYDVVNMKG